MCGNLAQGAGLVTLTTSQSAVTPGPRTEVTRQWDNSIRRLRLESVVFQPTISALNHKQSVNVGEVSAHRYLPINAMNKTFSK
jgi:hypothetical protein